MVLFFFRLAEEEKKESLQLLFSSSLHHYLSVIVSSFTLLWSGSNFCLLARHSLGVGGFTTVCLFGDEDEKFQERFDFSLRVGSDCISFVLIQEFYSNYRIKRAIR